VLLFPQPALQLIYDTAPIDLACLSPDCRYLQINQRLTEICGISVEDHLGRSVRDCVPALADSVEQIVRSIMETGAPITGIEVAGQRTDQRQAFDPFFTTRRHEGATGLGLHIAHSMVIDRLEGRLALESESGTGTVVRLILPRSIRSEPKRGASKS
jgi:PAS domain-containing protein